MHQTTTRRAWLTALLVTLLGAFGLTFAGSALAAPVAPGCLVAQAGTGTNTVKLTWNAVPGAVAYEVHEDLYNGADRLSATVTTTTRTSGTLATGNYRYFVEAKDSSGALSAASPKASVTVPMGSTVVRNPVGCAPTAALPTAPFTETPASGSTPLAVSFTDQSTGPATSWTWNFGDGSAQVTTQNASHTYSTAGTYTVTHTATNWQGTATVTHTVTASSAAAPVAAFTENPTSGTAPLAVAFTDTSTGGTATSWTWNFGDGSAQVTTQNASHTYSSVGTFTVTHTATNATGTSSATNTVSSTLAAPVAAFTENPTSGAAPLAVQFTDASTGGAASSWSWAFGDGATSTVQSPSHTYAAAGTYTVSLTATNATGSSTATNTVTASAAQQQTTNCLPNPHLCGFPDATNTGWQPTGVTLTPYTGPSTLSTPGQVIDGADITGPIKVAAANVTIKRSRIHMPTGYTTCPDCTVVVDVSGNGFNISDTEVSGLGADGNPTTATMCFNLLASGSVVSRVNVHGCGDGTRGGNFTFTDSYIHDFWYGMINGTAYDTPHADAWQGMGTASYSNWTIRHNTAVEPNAATCSDCAPTGGGYPNSISQIGDESGTPSNYLFDDNLFDGGNFLFNVAPTVQNLTFQNNHFGHNERWGLILTSGSYTWTNNVWDDTGAQATP